MARSVVGAACGAGAATAYLRPDVVAGYVFDKWDMFPSRASRGSDYKRELDELSKLVSERAWAFHGTLCEVFLAHRNEFRARWARANDVTPLQVQQLSRDVSGRQGVTIVHSGNEKCVGNWRFLRTPR